MGRGFAQCKPPPRSPREARGAAPPNAEPAGAALYARALVEDGKQGERARKGPGGLPTVVAAYVRVSSSSQDYAYQRHAIERAARARGEVIHLWYADVASGKTMNRPKLRALRDSIRAGRIHTLWVWRIDRLTRSGIVDTLGALQEMKRNGCALSSVSDGFALEGPAGELVVSVLAWAAQLEREKIRENQEAARARMRSEGRPWGRPPEITSTQKERIHLLAEQGWPHKRIAAEVNCSKTSVWNELNGTEPQAAAENMHLAKG
jgi:DNA invertase Pin-like site-specific DNA recombinase